MPKILTLWRFAVILTILTAESPVQSMQLQLHDRLRRTLHREDRSVFYVPGSMLQDGAARQQSTSSWQCLDISACSLGRKRELSSCEKRRRRPLPVWNVPGTTVSLTSLHTFVEKVCVCVCVCESSVLKLGCSSALQISPVPLVPRFELWVLGLTGFWSPSQSPNPKPAQGRSKSGQCARFISRCCCARACAARSV